jgi:hypothetical protein
VSLPESRRRIVLAVGALGCLALAAVLAVLAVDVARWTDAVESGDVRFRSAPEAARLWQADEIVRFSAARRALGIDDDIDFREAVRAMRLAGLDDPVVSDPEVAVRRNEAQARLDAIVAADADDSRRSRAAGLLGVLGLVRFMYETQEREALLAETVSNLRLAIALDPGNDDAKFNLELAYQRGRGLEVAETEAGENAAPGGSGSKGAGAGQPGSGY